jgi:hypothetical protein
MILTRLSPVSTEIDTEAGFKTRIFEQVRIIPVQGIKKAAYDEYDEHEQYLDKRHDIPFLHAEKKPSIKLMVFIISSTEKVETQAANLPAGLYSEKLINEFDVLLPWQVR